MRNNLRVSYDRVGDVLYILKRNVRATRNQEEQPGLVFRYDVKDNNPVGATIVDYREYWSGQQDVLASTLAQFLRIPKEEAKRVIHCAD